jgi:hypothetical protein
MIECPNFRSKRRMTSSGIAAPPDTQKRRPRKQGTSASGSRRSTLYMLGTSGRTVTPADSMVRATASGSNFTSGTSENPPTSGETSPTVAANAWNIGRTTSTTSRPASKPMVRITLDALADRLRWVSIAPFG